MKQTITILILTICSLTINGQSFSLTIDSLTLKHIKLLPADQQHYFDSILENRKNAEWLTRIDTSNFDYAFIEETFCYSDTTSKITERYFIKSDSIPKSIYVNGLYKEPKTIYDGFLIWYSKNVTYFTTLLPLIDNYSKLKATQELPYDKRQIWSHGCVVQENGEKKFEERRTEQLKTTYQIQTMVDRLNNKIVVSIQFAPKRPKFETYNYNGVWDW
ncbi:MAG: hypothetical protein D6734_08170 [Candidatus Schekmanbacteria bacterium]|nr:MAG: hypothetical protein D6734_08170 [Candidatus Schekmanbacteria bacterium]